MTEHRAEPTTTSLGVLVCKVCGQPVRTAFGGQYPIHAQVVISPFVRRALRNELPASDQTGRIR